MRILFSDLLPLTPSEFAKSAMSLGISATTATVAHDQIEQHTDWADDHPKVVDTGSVMLGWYVSAKLRPVTDAVVDKTASALASRKARKAARKSDKTPTE
jgi:hypothetical protein